MRIKLILISKLLNTIMVRDQFFIFLIRPRIFNKTIYQINHLIKKDTINLTLQTFTYVNERNGICVGPIGQTCLTNQE
jgi:hypothetical protein